MEMQGPPPTHTTYLKKMKFTGFDTSEKVGIGTTPSNARLAVGSPTRQNGSAVQQQAGYFVGTKTAYSSSANKGLWQNQLHVADNSAVAAGVGGAITFGATQDNVNGTYLASIEGSRDNATSGNYAGSMIFRTRTHGAALMGAHMVIASDGKVGIGTSAPTNKLEVYGDTSLWCANFRCPTDGHGVTIGNKTAAAAGYAAHHYWSGGDAGYYTIQPYSYTNSAARNLILTSSTSSKVGIGTTAPYYKFEVKGTDSNQRLGIQHNTATTKRMHLAYNSYLSGNTNWYGLYTGSTGMVTFYEDGAYQTNVGAIGFSIDRIASDNSVLGANPAPKMIITTDGRVGIGTTAPVNDLQIGSVGSTNFGGNDIAFGNGTNAGAFFQDNSYTNIYTSNSFKFWSTGTASAVITDNAANDPQIQLANGKNTRPSYAFMSDIDTGMYRPAADTLRFTTYGTDRLTIDPSGNVGIGTVSPGSYKLNVQGLVNIGTTAAGGVLRLEGKGGVGYAMELKTTTYSGLYFQSNGVAGPRFDVYSKKNSFGVGATPTALLHVAGAIVVGNVNADPHIPSTAGGGFSNGNAYTIDFVTQTTATVGSGDYVTITWAKPSWAAVSWEATLAMNGGYKVVGSFYNNNQGSSWGSHVHAVLYNNTGQSTPFSIGTSTGQTVAWKFLLPSGYHPHIHMVVTGGGGATPKPEDFTVVWTDIG
jgi:hypothetical protein